MNKQSEETNNREIEEVVKISQKYKVQEQMASQVNLTKYLKKN